MSKAILVSNRQGKDKETEGDLLWITLYMLPRAYKKKDGTSGLYYLKKDEALVTVCITKALKPDDYAKLKNVKEGAICVLKYIVDEYSNKAKVDTIDVLPGTDKYTPEQLYKD